MNVFEVSIETPISISQKVNTSCYRGWEWVLGNVTGWVGLKRPFSAWRIDAMAPCLNLCFIMIVILFQEYYLNDYIYIYIYITSNNVYKEAFIMV